MYVLVFTWDFYMLKYFAGTRHGSDKDVVRYRNQSLMRDRNSNVEKVFLSFVEAANH